MSHKTTVTSKLKSKFYITQALKEMGFGVTVGEGNNLLTRGSYGVHEKVEILINSIDGRNINDCIGFALQSDGTYSATGDFYGTRWTAGKLTEEVTMKANTGEVNDRLMALGFQLEQTNNNNGEVELTYTRY